METTNREIEGKTSCWYAVYTAGRAEKKVKERLDTAGIESYLPLQSVIRLWNNRKRKVMIPVVPGYIFVHLPVGDVPVDLPAPVDLAIELALGLNTFRIVLINEADLRGAAHAAGNDHEQKNCNN